MLEKIKATIEKALRKLPKLDFKGNMWLIYTAVVLLFGSIILYIGTWTWLMFWRAATGLEELKEIIYVICGAPFIAALTMLRNSAVDKNGDGVSDLSEREVENKNGNEKNYY